MDLLKLIRTWISLWCYNDFSKLLHRFVKLGTCFSRPLPNKPSWSFTNVLKLNHWLKMPNEVLFSQYVMLYNHHITLQYITLLTAFSASYTGLPGLYPLCPFSATWPKVERMIDSVDLTLKWFNWLIFQLVWSIVIQLIYVELIYVSPPSPSTPEASSLIFSFSSTFTLCLIALDRHHLIVEENQANSFVYLFAGWKIKITLKTDNFLITGCMFWRGIQWRKKRNIEINQNKASNW